MKQWRFELAWMKHWRFELAWMKLLVFNNPSTIFKNEFLGMWLAGSDWVQHVYSEKSQSQ